MKNKIVILLIFFVPLSIYFLLSIINPKYSMDLAATAKVNTPQVLVFSTPMCGECHKMAPVIEKAKKNYAGAIEIVKINAADNNENTIKLVKQHKIYVVPTIIYANKDGKILRRTEGSMSYDQFDNYLKGLIK